VELRDVTKMPESLERSVMEILRHAIGEIDLFWIGTQIVERHHRYRRLVR